MLMRKKEKSFVHRGVIMVETKSCDYNEGKSIGRPAILSTKVKKNSKFLSSRVH